jgi:uncharacterized protein (TIGR02452 family)
MTDHRHRTPRWLARKLGEAAVRIIRTGGYETSSGRWVDISDEIASATAGTESYPPERPVRFDAEPRGTFRTSSVIEVRNETTLSAARRLLADGHDAAVLNFASATSPGGGFLHGARAQEEYLARSSGLYACLEGNPMYPFHRERGDHLYTNYVIYSPRVPVFRDDAGALLEEPFTIGIITSPAVNAAHLPEELFDEIEGAMRERIRKVLAVGLLHGHDAIVLGAWGCGAFGNDGHQIARLFREHIEGEFRDAYRRIVFAVVDWSGDKRYIGPFREAFGGE